MNPAEKIEEFRKKENFPVASLLLPKQARLPIRALYRFARLADEISDDSNISNEERKRLLIEIYDSLKAGDDGSDYFHECRDGKMSLKHGLALLEAFIQDTEKKRYESWGETLDYCQRSAATIGRSVLEATGEFAADVSSADKICMVLQLVNHVQDIKADYVNDGRIYFDAGLINPDDIGLDAETVDFTAGKAVIIARLRDMLYSAGNIFETINSFRVRAEIATIYNIALMLLDKLEGNDVLGEKRVELTDKEKKRALKKGVMLALKIRPLAEYSSASFAILSRSSFIKPLLTLDKGRRKAMLCFYAFCRLIDDAVDNAKDNTDAALRLKQWNDEVERIYSPDLIVLPKHPVSRELGLYINKYSIAKNDLLEMIEGQRMDISGAMNWPSDEVLDKYCYRVASCVGLVSVRIFGYYPENEGRITRFAIALGKALQLVNIMRDVKEDARNGRIYLPASLLEKHGFNYNAEEIYTGYEMLKGGIVPILEDVSHMADGYFAEAMGNLPENEYKNMRPALLMMRVYKNYLEKMRAQRFVFERSDIKLSILEKVKIFYEPVGKI